MFGTIFDNFTTVRVLELSKVRSKKLILTKTKYELAVVCPGEVTNMPGNKDKVYAKEPRLMLALNVFTNQIKGKYNFAK